MSNRAERRRQERKDQEFNSRKTFTKQEVEKMNIAAYDLGVSHALTAAHRKLGIGKIRQKRMIDHLEVLQVEQFGKRNR